MAMQHMPYKLLRDWNVAEIIGHTSNGVVLYEWIGKSPLALVRGDVDISELPWPMRELGKDFDPLYPRLMIRTDRFWWLAQWQYRLIIALCRIAHVMKYRIIATLEIWGLAHTPEWCVRSWSHIGKRRGR